MEIFIILVKWIISFWTFCPFSSSSLIIFYFSLSLVILISLFTVLPLPCLLHPLAYLPILSCCSSSSSSTSCFYSCRRLFLLFLLHLPSFPSFLCTPDFHYYWCCCCWYHSIFLCYYYNNKKHNLSFLQKKINYQKLKKRNVHYTLQYLWK